MPGSEADTAADALLEAMGQRMRDVRERAGLSQAEVARRAGLSRYWYIRAEAGTANLSVKQVKAIADALSVEVGFFFVQV